MKGGEEVASLHPSLLLVSHQTSPTEGKRCDETGERVET